MKVVVFHRANDYTGSTRVLSNIIQSKFANDEVVVITDNSKNYGFLDELPDLKLVALWFPTFNGKRIKGLSFVLSQIHLCFLSVYYALKADLFYLNTITQYIPALIGDWMEKRMVIHVHEKFVSTGWEESIMDRTFRTVKAQRIFVSNWLQQQYGLTGKENTVEYNQLSASFLRQVIPRSAADRTRNQIIMLSSLTKAKGIFVLIQLAQLLPQYQFIWVVSASREDVRLFFEGSDIPANLQVITSPGDVHPYYAKADLVLSLSDPNQWVETFGMTILEAMPYGIPAIVPTVGGPAELVIDGFNGYCVDVTDAHRVASAIRKALSDQNYPQLVQNTFERFRQIN